MLKLWIVLSCFKAASLTNIMKILGESIVHHMKYYIQLFHDDDKERDFKPLKHRLLVHRMTVVNLSTFLLQFLESLVPLEMVRHIFVCVICNWEFKTTVLF